MTSFSQYPLNKAFFFVFFCSFQIFFPSVSPCLFPFLFVAFLTTIDKNICHLIIDSLTPLIIMKSERCRLESIEFRKMIQFFKHFSQVVFTCILECCFRICKAGFSFFIPFSIFSLSTYFIYGRNLYNISFLLKCIFVSD